MSSLLTNSAAMTALSTLRSINKDVETTTARISTGQRVSTAADNAAYWSIATTMRNQNTTNSAVMDSLGLGAAILDSTTTALNEAVDIAKQIQAKYVARETGGVETGKIDDDVAELKNQIIAIAKSATFNGKNLLASTGAAVDVVTGYSSSVGGGTASVDKLTVAAYDLEADVASATDATTTETFINNIIDAAAKMGVASTRIQSQMDFTKAMTEAFDRGIGQLVDADMEKESTRLQALQVQQQLGIQSLSIANQNAQSILSLFR